MIAQRVIRIGWCFVYILFPSDNKFFSMLVLMQELYPMQSVRIQPIWIIQPFLKSLRFDFYWLSMKFSWLITLLFIKGIVFIGQSVNILISINDVSQVQ